MKIENGILTGVAFIAVPKSGAFKCANEYFMKLEKSPYRNPDGEEPNAVSLETAKLYTFASGARVDIVPDLTITQRKAEKEAAANED